MSRPLRRGLLGRDLRRSGGFVALAVVLYAVAGENVLSVPYPPINVIAVYTVLGGLAAAANAYDDGGVVVSWLLVFLPSVGADGVGLIGLLLFPLLLFQFESFLTALSFGSVGHALGSWLRLRHQGTDPDSVDRVLLGRDPRTTAVGLAGAVPATVLAITLVEVVPSAVEMGYLQTAITLVSVAVGVAVVYRRGGAVAVWALVAGPLVATVGYWTAAEGARLSVIVGNVLTFAGGAAVPTVFAYVAGTGLRRGVERGRSVYELDRSELASRAGVVAGRLRARLAPASRQQFAAVVVIGVLLSGFYVPLATPLLEPWPPSGGEETSFTLTRTACLGSCPIYTVRVCGNGTGHFVGEKYVEGIGYHRFEVPESTVWELQRTAYRIDFFRMRSWFTVPATDLPSAITTVRIGDRTHRVSDYGGSGPPRLARFRQLIDRTAGDLSVGNESARSPDREFRDVPAC